MMNSNTTPLQLKLPRATACAILMSQALACAAADPAGSVGTTDDETVAQTGDAIYNSDEQPSFGAATIRITGLGACTATLVNNHVIVTAAHCLHPAGGSSIGNDTREVTLNYEAPDGTVVSVTQDFFFYSHPNYAGTEVDDIAVGGTDISLGLANHHFAYVMRDTVQVDDDMVVAGYGSSTTDSSATPRRLAGTLTSVSGRSVNWASQTAWQGVCSGDSGAPYFMDSGEGSRDGQPQLPILAGVHSGGPGAGSLPAPGSGFCNSNGWGNIVSTYFGVIQDVVEFYPRETPGNYQCTSFDAPSGDRVARCWDFQSCESQCQVQCAEAASASGNWDSIQGCQDFCTLGCD